MHTYELVSVGSAQGRIVRGWSACRADAHLTATSTGQAVDVWSVPTARTPRARKLTVFPDGSVARPRPLHRQPQL